MLNHNTCTNWIQGTRSNHVYTVSDADPFVSSPLWPLLLSSIHVSLSLSIHFYSFLFLLTCIYFVWNFHFHFLLPTFCSSYTPSKEIIMKLTVLKTRILWPYGQWILSIIFAGIFRVIEFPLDDGPLIERKVN